MYNTITRKESVNHYLLSYERVKDRYGGWDELNRILKSLQKVLLTTGSQQPSLSLKSLWLSGLKSRFCKNQSKIIIESNGINPSASPSESPEQWGRSWWNADAVELALDQSGTSYSFYLPLPLSSYLGIPAHLGSPSLLRLAPIRNSEISRKRQSCI